jgi:hypothetical protein
MAGRLEEPAENRTTRGGAPAAPQKCAEWRYSLIESLSFRPHRPDRKVGRLSMVEFGKKTAPPERGKLGAFLGEGGAFWCLAAGKRFKGVAKKEAALSGQPP